MGVNARRGHTGQIVQEAGTYKSEAGELWTYVRGDKFRDERNGKSTIWKKAKEVDHPGGTR